MLNVFPDYYKSFKCISSACRHSCCIGWEIDVDESTLNKYKNLRGDIGAKLEKNISLEDTPHFILGKDERCPFLNGENLCELILACGEDILCDICRDHPRFRSFLPGRIETGLGLCCEEAARIIIDHDAPMTLVYEGEQDENDDYAGAVITLRDELLETANDVSRSYDGRVKYILSRCRISFPEKTPSQWAELLLSLERMDDEWTALLEKLCEVDISEFEPDSRSGNLLSYFIYRHVAGAADDGNIQGRVLFCVISVYLINLLCAVHGSDKIYDIARLYSAEVEYSAENTDKLMNLQKLL